MMVTSEDWAGTKSRAQSPFQKKFFGHSIQKPRITQNQSFLPRVFCPIYLFRSIIIFQDLIFFPELFCLC